MKVNFFLVDLAIRSVAILELSLTILRWSVAIMAKYLLNERERDGISWVIKYSRY